MMSAGFVHVITGVVLPTQTTVGLKCGVSWHPGLVGIDNNSASHLE